MLKVFLMNMVWSCNVLPLCTDIPSVGNKNLEVVVDKLSVTGPLDLAKVKAFDRLLDAMHEFDAIPDFIVDGEMELQDSIIRLGMLLLGSRRVAQEVMGVVRDVPSGPDSTFGLMGALGWLWSEGIVELDDVVAAQVLAACASVG
jgi:hypothetical protein